MLNIDGFKDSLVNEIGLLHPDFAFQKSKFCYRSKCEAVEQQFRVELVKQPDSFLVAPAVYVSHRKVNKVLREATGLEITSSDPTYGFRVCNEYEGRGKYFVGDEDLNVVEAAQHIRLDFQEIALLFYKRIQNLKDLETELCNPPKVSHYKGLSVYYLCWLICAGENFNSDFLRIYNSILSEFQSTEAGNAELRANQIERLDWIRSHYLEKESKLGSPPTVK